MIIGLQQAKKTPITANTIEMILQLRRCLRISRFT